MTPFYLNIYQSNSTNKNENENDLRVEVWRDGRSGYEYRVGTTRENWTV